MFIRRFERDAIKEGVEEKKSDRRVIKIFESFHELDGNQMFRRFEARIYSRMEFSRVMYDRYFFFILDKITVGSNSEIFIRKSVSQRV